MLLTTIFYTAAHILYTEGLSLRVAGKALGSDIPPGQRRNFMQHPCTACRNHKLPPALKKHQKILSGRLTFICLMYPKFHSLSYYVNGFCPIHMPPYSNLFFSLNSTQFFQFSELVLKGNFTLHTGMKKIVSFDLGKQVTKNNKSIMTFSHWTQS